MAVYKCEICDELYDEDSAGVSREDLKDDWECPVCGSDISLFKEVDDTETKE